MGMLERAKKLEKRDSKSWKPEEGDVIAGKVVAALTLVRFENGDERYMLKVLSEENNEEMAVWAGKILFDLFKELNAQVGDEIAVKCFGYPEGKRYKDFAVDIERHTPYVPYAEPKQGDLPWDGAADGSDAITDELPPF